MATSKQRRAPPATKVRAALPRATALPKPSEAILAELPERALRFLRTIATRSAIRSLMFEGGFRAEDHVEGWALLTRACEYRTSAADEAAVVRVQTATAELQRWVATHFGRYRAALERLHPEWAGLFVPTDPRYPNGALLAVGRLVQQLRRIRASHDTALIGTLEHRGLDTKQLEYLARLLAEAQGTAENVAEIHDGARAEVQDARSDALVGLYHWYRDWTETARRLVTRKDYRLSLGIGVRQSSAKAASATPTEADTDG